MTFLARLLRSIVCVRGLAQGKVQLIAPSAAVTGVVPAEGGAALTVPEPGVGEAGADSVAALEGPGLEGAALVGAGVPDCSGSAEPEQLVRAAIAAIEVRTETADLTNMRDWMGIREL